MTNYRSCGDAVIELQPDLTILVGENGAGKTNIIDALRSAIYPAPGRRNYYFDHIRDRSIWSDLGSWIECSLTFVDLTEIEQAIFISQVVDKHGKLIYTIRFDTNQNTPARQRQQRSIGEARLADLEPENYGRIACVYLPPLRDAARVLDSTDSNQLAEIMISLSSAVEREAFLEQGNSSLRDLSEHLVPARAIFTIQEHLTDLTHPVTEQKLTVNPRDSTIYQLARLLRLRMAEEGVDPGDLSSSGLGYANLLFVASVMVEIQKSQEYDLTLFLVEEPEAHLHPQLQSVLLKYLEKKSIESARGSGNPDSPAGRIQVIVTSHSPNVAGAVSTSKIVAVRKLPVEHHGQKLVQTRTDSLAKRELLPRERMKIDRYLTVTRASLLFGRRVMLVEGISEAILIQSIAENHIFASESDRKMREQFQATTIVAIDGTDFMPYLKLLLGGEVPLVDKAIVVTDGDNTDGEKRKAKYYQEFQTSTSNKTLEVFVGDVTLEADLYAIEVNESILKQAYLEQHRNSGAKWDALADKAAQTGTCRATVFSRSIGKRDEEDMPGLDLAKGEYSQAIAAILASQGPEDVFTLPQYLEDAIRSSVKI